MTRKALASAARLLLLSLFALAHEWHLGTPTECLPTHRGFDEWLGLPYSNDQWPLHPEKPGKFPPLPLYDGDKAIYPDLSHRDMEKLTTQYTERAVSSAKGTRSGRSSFTLRTPCRMCRSR